MIAGITAMRLFDQKAVEYVNELGDLARKKITHAIEKVGIKACVTGVGSMFRIHLKPQAPKNYRQSYANEDEAKGLKLVLEHLFEQGLMMINTCSAMLSTAMAEKEIMTLVEHLTSGFEKLLSNIFH
jgi:glutamate-1-semialdehyde 2,1-aminomutase